MYFLIFIISVVSIEHRRIYQFGLLCFEMSLPELCKNFTSDTCSAINRSEAFNGRFRSVELKPSQRYVTMDQIITECRPGIDASRVYI